MITVLADRHHYQLERHLHPSIRLVPYDPIAGWTVDQVRQADALLVRTTNAVNSSTLPEGSRVRFVATASAGRDHLDEAWLERLGITVADAKGSNARSVAEYVAIAVLLMCDDQELSPQGLTAGVVGAGFTGTATADLLGRIGITCKRHDPPREEREWGTNPENARSTGLQQQDPAPVPFRSASLEEVLGCDIITLHVPLERGGPYPTWHWLDGGKLASVKPGTMIINASRGGVADERALLASHRQGLVRSFTCDVWEGEPVFSDITARQAHLATPHIAGYSIEAKRNASLMMCETLHRFFDLPEPPAGTEPPRRLKLPEDPGSLREVLSHVHPASTYDSALRSIIDTPDPQKGPAFLRLRQDTPLRNEFRQIALPSRVADRHPVLKALGFPISETETT